MNFCFAYNSDHSQKSQQKSTTLKTIKTRYTIVFTKQDTMVVAWKRLRWNWRKGFLEQFPSNLFPGIRTKNATNQIWENPLEIFGVNPLEIFGGNPSSNFQVICFRNCWYQILIFSEGIPPPVLSSVEPTVNSRSLQVLDCSKLVCYFSFIANPLKNVSAGSG